MYFFIRMCVCVYVYVCIMSMNVYSRCEYITLLLYHIVVEILFLNL